MIPTAPFRLFAAATVLLTAAGFAHAAEIRHVGTNDPTTEDGYTTEAGNQFWNVNDEVGPNPSNLGPVDGQAWQVAGSGGGQSGYSYNITPTPADNALGSAGWIFTVILRMPTVNDTLGFGVMAGYANGSTLYFLQFGTDGDGDPIVRVFDTGSPPSFTLEGAGNADYHQYDLIYNGSTLNLYVDGLLRIPNASAFGSPGSILMFGDAGDDAGTGNFALVRWATPEPSSAMLLALAGSALVRRRVG